MKNKDIEKKLRRAFENAVPDVLPSVLERCDSVSPEKRAPVRPPFSRRFTALRRTAAGLAAVFAITAGLLFFNNIGRQDIDPEANILSSTDALTYAAQDMTALSPEGVLRAAAEYLKLDFGDIEESSAELISGDNGCVYLVKISSGKVFYALYVDAATGEIVEPREFTN